MIPERVDSKAQKESLDKLEKLIKDAKLDRKAEAKPEEKPEAEVRVDYMNRIIREDPSGKKDSAADANQADESKKRKIAGLKRKTQNFKVEEDIEN